MPKLRESRCNTTFGTKQLWKFSSVLQYRNTNQSAKTSLRPVAHHVEGQLWLLGDDAA
jgi:hypothetical protein